MSRTFAFESCFALKVKGDGGGEATWIVDAKNGKGKVEFNGKAKPDVTFTTSDADLFDLMRGELNPQKAFFAVSYKTCFRNSQLNRGRARADPF